MARRDRYSRLVILLKVVLPLVALGLMSTIFLVSRSIDPEQAVAMAPVDIGELVREPRISEARFAGVTQDGSALTVLAGAARADPDRGLHLTLTDLTGMLESREGQQMEFHAIEGTLDQAGGTLIMQGDVRFHGDPGYDLRMQSLRAALDRTEVRGWGDVTGRGPAGEISAAEVVLRPADADGGGHILVFTGNVRLIYTPGN